MTTVEKIYQLLSKMFPSRSGLSGQGPRITKEGWAEISSQFSGAELALLQEYFRSRQGKETFERFKGNLTHPQLDVATMMPYDRRLEKLNGNDVISLDLFSWKLPVSLLMNRLSEKEYEALVADLFGEFTLQEAKRQTQLAIKHVEEVQQQITNRAKCRAEFKTDLFVSGTGRAEKCLDAFNACNEPWAGSFRRRAEELVRKEREIDGYRNELVVAGIKSLAQLKAMVHLFSSSVSTLGHFVIEALEHVENGRFELQRYLNDPEEVVRESRQRKADELSSQAREAETLADRAKAKAISIAKQATAAIKAITK